MNFCSNIEFCCSLAFIDFFFVSSFKSMIELNFLIDHLYTNIQVNFDYWSMIEINKFFFKKEQKKSIDRLIEWMDGCKNKRKKSILINLIYDGWFVVVVEIKQLMKIWKQTIQFECKSFDRLIPVKSIWISHYFKK